MLKIAFVILNVIVFWVLAPLGMYAAGRAVDHHFMLASPPGLAPFGAVLCALGVVLCVWAIATLMRRGRGYPISALPPSKFVVKGPYRVMRHPIYTGLFIAMAGAGLFLGSLGFTVVVVPVVAVLWFGIWVKLFEEPTLMRRFGRAYRVYRNHVALVFPVGLAALLRRVILMVIRIVTRLRVTDRKNVPRSGAFVAFCDHMNYLDFVYAQCVSGKPIVSPVTVEAFRKPLQRAVMRLLGGVPTRRFCSDHAAMLALAEEVACGNRMGIAVPGERSWYGELNVPAANVAANMLQFDVPLLPVVFVGSYRQWPRWAKRPDLGSAVTARIGAPFRLRDKLVDIAPEGRVAAAQRVLYEELQALRDPAETSCRPTAYPGARPELSLWRCPICRAEETLSFQERRRLVCGECGATWDTADGDFTLVRPEAQAGTKATLYEWAQRTGMEAMIEGRAEPILEADAALQHDPEARITLDPLHDLGQGRALLMRDRIEWTSDTRQRVLSLDRVRSVTTERNDTLQLGYERGVVQLVFAHASPLRWQIYVEALRAEAAASSKAQVAAAAEA